MEFAKFLILVKGLKSAYTSQNYLPDEDSVKVWFNLLKDIPYDVLNNAIIRWISTERFPPTIADLRKMSFRTVEGAPEDWAEAWKNVKKAIQKFGSYRETEGLNSLSDAERQAAQRIGWTELCMMDIDNESTNRAQFRDIFNAILSRREQDGVISERVRIAAEQARNGIDEKRS